MFSLRRRLLGVAVLAAVALASAVFSIVMLVRSTTEQRVDRAHESVMNEVERLRELFDQAPAEGTRRRGRRGFGELRSGFIDAQFRDESPSDLSPLTRAARAEAARDSLADGAVVVRDLVARDGTAFVVAAAPVRSGYAWAVSRVATPPDARSWRVGMLLLSLTSLVMVVASLHTLSVFQQGASSLVASIGALAVDLRANVGRPKVRELGEVADGIASLARDLSRAQVERERLTRELAERERLAALGRIVAGVAHEVRNPLAAIKLRVDLAQGSRDVGAPLASDLGEISAEVARLDRLVADLLVVAGRKPGPMASADLGALVRRRAELLAPWAHEKGVTFEVRGEAVATVDADAIARVVDNLLRNAAEASPRDASVGIDVATEGGKARVTVEDRGAGVAEAQAHELFEPFFTTKRDGTGLGLALSRSLAASHDGTLTYERAGDRTRFTLLLPLR